MALQSTQCSSITEDLETMWSTETQPEIKKWVMSTDFCCSGYCSGRDQLNHADGNCNSYHSHLSSMWSVTHGKERGLLSVVKTKGREDIINRLRPFSILAYRRSWFRQSNLPWVWKDHNMDITERQVVAIMLSQLFGGRNYGTYLSWRRKNLGG